MKFRWSLASPEPLLAGQLAKLLRISPLLAQCLLNRGVSQAEHLSTFLEPRLKQLADPFLLPAMAAAVERLWRARELCEALVIFGDYDVDGVTSTALLVEVLRKLGWQVHYYLPHRRDEGYGLTREAVENCLRKHQVRLLLAVDCGSSSTEVVAELMRSGVDVLILDHHQIAKPAPPAVALVNPHAIAEMCPVSEAVRPAVPGFTELCSVGLAFKLAHALLKHGRGAACPKCESFDLRPYLELVALGTIADVVPLLGENRIFVSSGLERPDKTQRPGLVALKGICKCPPVLNTQHVGFQLAPRLNAAGRLETAEASLRLLLTDNPAEALQLAQQLDAQNRERQTLERSISRQAIAEITAKFDAEKDFVIVEGQPPWHIGVVGIVASRVLQQFYRPTIIVGGDGPFLRGSGRSIVGFDLAAALRDCGDLLLRHGGHAMAAGVSIHPEKLADFRSRINELARRGIQPETLQQPLQLDAEVGFEELSIESLHEFSRLNPTGQSNPPVQFVTRNLIHQRPIQRLGTDKQHVKMWLSDGATAHEAIWWNAGKDSLPMGKFDIAFAPQVNEFNGRKLVQLKVLDWRSA